MSVERFLDELKFLLSDLPDEEREEAIDYYRCYFEDAGEENEEAVIAELGSPERVAYTIREGLKEKEDEGEYTETGYHTYDDISAPATRYAHKEEDKKMAGNVDEYNHISAEERYKQRYAKPGKKEAKQAKKEQKQAQKYDKQTNKSESKSNANAGNGTGQKKTTKQAQSTQTKEKNSDVPAPLRIIGEILMGIVKILMAIAAICIVILLICALIALIAVVAASLVVTIGFLVVGIGMMATGSGLVGVALIGLSFISFAVFLLLLIALVAFCKKGFAGGIRGITSTAGNVVHGRKKKEA